MISMSWSERELGARLAPSVTFTLDGGAKVNDANITTADIAASNGVIHVIDAVIMPPAN